MKAQFKLRDPKSNGETSIRLVSYIQGDRLVYSIGESISPKLWDLDKQRVIIPRGNKEVQDISYRFEAMTDHKDMYLYSLKSQ